MYESVFPSAHLMRYALYNVGVDFRDQLKRKMSIYGPSERAQEFHTYSEKFWSSDSQNSRILSQSDETKVSNQLRKLET